MNPRNVTTQIDADACIGCGSCIRVCPSQTITLEDNIARVTGEKSLSCGHCEAVCPARAIRVHALDPEMTRFSTFALDPGWLGFGEFSTGDLARVMASRRSCRNYKDHPVPVDVLNDLVKLACLAPSGTNSQEWTFTCLPDRGKVLGFGSLVKSFFEALNKKAENPVLRKGLSLVGFKALDNYFQEYYE